MIPWTGPIPRGSKVSVTGRGLFKSVSGTLGSSLPRDLDDRFVRDQHEVDVFNASLAGDLDAVDRWNSLYGLRLSDEPRRLFQRYLDQGDFVIFQSLVDHPPALDIERYAACSVTFQRGDIFFARGRQDLFLRSYFHSAKSSEEFVNFAPSGGLRISFESDSIWYPLEVTQLNAEPTSVVLNLMTEEPLGKDQVPDGFSIQKRGRVVHGLASYTATRLTATFPGGEAVPDVNIVM